MIWNYSDMPKDGTRIVRWHKYWKCPIAVFYSEPNKPDIYEWIEASVSHSWPEESFVPDAWAYYPEAPSNIISHLEETNILIEKFETKDKTK